MFQRPMSPSSWSLSLHVSPDNGDKVGLQNVGFKPSLKWLLLLQKFSEL